MQFEGSGRKILLCKSGGLCYTVSIVSAFLLNMYSAGRRFYPSHDLDKEMISLLIRRMTATFGRLREQTLELQEGLNILQAPNETGKSTWCAFLLAMLYGVNTKERDRAGTLADKNRYAPWDGGAMSGRLDCRAGGDALTLIRSTRRQAAPMGDFQALYTGTADPVPGLTGTNCGETLLGVSREVYARSAFIRQGGIPVTQDPGLERRIAALVTSGEEDTSYTEAAEILKKQLNSRRRNKTGQLPALEAELRETEASLASLAELSHQREELLARSAELEARRETLNAEIAALDRWEAQKQRREAQKAKDAAVRAEERAEALRRRLEEEHIPENDTTGRLRGAIVNLNTVRKSAEKAQEACQEAAKVLSGTDQKLAASPFRGQTAEEARKGVQNPPAPPRGADWPAILTALAGFAAALAVLFAILPHTAPYLAFGVSALIAALACSAAALIHKHKLAKARKAILTELYGTAVPEEISALLDAYVKLLEDRDAAKQAYTAKAAAAQGLWESVDANAEGILAEVRRFAPSAYDILSADAALRASALMRKELREAEEAAREARLLAELQAAPPPEDPESPEEAPPLSPPERSRQAAAAELEEVQAGLSVLRSSLDRVAGRLHATGDPAALQASAERLTGEIAVLEKEYAAIGLAMDALSRANIQLQSRFSPALGQRAAEIFGRLTAGAYDGVILNKALHAAAEPAGTGVPRDAEYLSAGAADQLYLAVRLAICDLILPEDAPIVLDDALASFDDARCAAALDYLREAAEKRQILLFTCHGREADALRRGGAVSIQVLTASGERV